MNSDKKIARHLYDFVKKKVDLAEFLETEASCNLKWYQQNISAGTICPMPHHKDSKPSFRIKFMEEDEVWIYHCLGCGSKGTIIDFVMEYYGLNNAAEAVLFICDKYDFKDDADLVTSCLKDIKKKIDFHKKMEYTHIVTCNQCRMLLRKDYEKHSKWVGATYRKMNDALAKENTSIIEEIGFEASQRMGME